MEIAPSRVLNVEQFTISLSRPQMAHATAPSVNQCKGEQVTELHVPSHNLILVHIKWSHSLNPTFSPVVPCPPDTIEVQLLPMQMEVQVTRVTWTQMSCGDTEYMLALTGSLLGDSQALFELSSYWTNSTYFEIPLPCGSSYQATVQSRNSAGTSNASVALSGTTGRLHPTLELLFTLI